jgi:DNA-binding PadR family transcriptional regulator
VSAREVEQQGRPDKQLHSLTDAGRAAFAAWLAEPAHGDRGALVLQLFLGGLASAASHLAALEAFRETVREELAGFAEIDARNSRRGHDLFHAHVLDLGIARAQASLDWADSRLAEHA